FHWSSFDSQLLMSAFEKPPPSCRKDDLAVALTWFRDCQFSLPASWAFAVARQHPRFAHSEALQVPNEQLTSLFRLRYREQFGDGLKPKASDTSHELRYRPINASLEYRDETARALSWSSRIEGPSGHDAQFAPLAELVTQLLRDLPPTNSTTL